MRTFLITTFLISTFTPNDSIVIGEVLDILSVGKDIVVALAKAWNVIDDHLDFTDTPTSYLQKTERKLFSKMNLIEQKLNNLNSKIETVGSQTLSEFKRYLPSRLRLELHLNNLLDYMTRLNVFHSNMKHYVNATDIEDLTLQDFAKTVVSHDSGSVRSLLERIHAYIAPIDNGLGQTNILESIANSLKVG